LSEPLKRWLDPESGASDHVRSLLDAARRPDAAAQARIWQAIEAATGAAAAATAEPSSGGPSHPPAPAHPLATTALKTVTALVLGLALSSGPNPANPPAPTPPATPAVARTVVPASAAPTVSPPVPTAPPPVAPVVAAMEPSGAPRAERAPVRTVLARAAHAPVQTTVLPTQHMQAEQTLPPTNPITLTVPPLAATPTGNSVGDGGPHSYSGGTRQPESETVAVNNAIVAALGAMRAGDAAHALSILEESEHLYPRANQERDSTVIRALVRLGRNAEAVARADRFLAANPTSTLAPAVRALRNRAAPAPTPAPAQ
jgi:hypothetical protein